MSEIDAQAPTPSVARLPARKRHLIAGSVLLALAGCIFVLNCVVAGFQALTVGGIDFTPTGAYQAYTNTTVFWTFWPSAVIAVAGL